ncbi:MAG TPA: UDP-N-acetylmuramoyl-L-alanine--D-glutamate ligase [Micromonosporaceae bacterium]
MRYLVVGSGMAAAACVRALLATDADVTVTDRAANAVTEELSAAGARIVIASPPPLSLLDDVDEVIVSPGVPPHDALAAAAVARGLDVYSEPELAWRRRGPDAPPWLALTGTNGKTTTVTMVAAILAAAGRRGAALGNIGVPLVDAPDDLDAIAVELSSFQLYWSSRMGPQVGAILNLADDHLEWHLTFDAYAAAKFEIWRAKDCVAIGNLDDARVAAALAAVDRHRIGFTLAPPPRDAFGVADGWLVDNAVAEEPTRIIEASRIRPPGAHNVANALAAAAITRAYGISIEAVHDGLAAYVPEPHRNELIAEIDGVQYVDDSKATNPHAALGSLLAYPSIVWVAGGQLKGVDVDDLVAAVAPRLRGAVLIGIDRADIAAALARHAPDLPVVDVSATDDGAMDIAVRAAVGLAEPGDTVLLAPAAASKDMYTSYAARSAAFVAAVAAQRA